MLILQKRHQARNRKNVCQKRRQDTLFLLKQMRKKPIKTQKKAGKTKMGDQNKENKRGKEMNTEQTLILAKPDAVQRGLVGEIIKRFEKVGMKIAGIKMIQANEGQLGQHYKDDKEWKLSVGNKTLKVAKEKGIEMNETAEQIGSRIRKWNMETLKFCPIIAMVFEGPHAIEFGRKLVGNTEPRQSPPGTIRGDYSIESYAIADAKKRTTLNLVHASESKSEAEREIKIWFNADELYDYEHKMWEITHR